MKCEQNRCAPLPGQARASLKHSFPAGWDDMVTRRKKPCWAWPGPSPTDMGHPSWTVTWGKQQISFLSHIIVGFRVTATEPFPLANRFRYSGSWALTWYLTPHIIPDKNDKVALSVSYLRYTDSEVIITYRILPWWIKSADIQGHQVVSLIVWKT